MSNVCYVPLSYIFLRGQGVKVSSIIAHECNKEVDVRIPTLKSMKNVMIRRKVLKVRLY